MKKSIFYSLYLLKWNNPKILYFKKGGGFQPNFTLYQKSEVNGANRMDLYKWTLGLCDVAPKPEFPADKGAYFIIYYLLISYLDT
jgi:hypothetical protein